MRFRSIGPSGNKYVVGNAGYEALDVKPIKKGEHLEGEELTKVVGKYGVEPVGKGGVSHTMTLITGGKVFIEPTTLPRGVTLVKGWFYSFDTYPIEGQLLCGTLNHSVARESLHDEEFVVSNNHLEKFWESARVASEVPIFAGEFDTADVGARSLFRGINTMGRNTTLVEMLDCAAEDAKRKTELLRRAFMRLQGADCGLRYFNVYGDLEEGRQVSEEQYRENWVGLLAKVKRANLGLAESIWTAATGVRETESRLRKAAQGERVTILVNTGVLGMDFWRRVANNTLALPEESGSYKFGRIVLQEFLRDHNVNKGNYLGVAGQRRLVDWGKADRTAQITLSKETAQCLTRRSGKGLWFWD